MARKLETIQASIYADIQAHPELAAANSTSRRAIWRLFADTMAAAILLFEQILDVFKSEVNATINASTPATAAWLTNKVFSFQYSDTNPQVVEVNDLVASYPVVDDSLKIITRCSVVTSVANRVIVKVAKNEPPEALASLELSALQGYVNTIGVAGVSYFCYSTDSDKLYINADIYYEGQYSSTIQGTVINSIEQYLANLPFNGQLKLSDLEFAIRNTTGVNDVLLKDVKIRPDDTAWAAGTYLVQGQTVISRLFPTVSGYVTGEDTPGYTLSDSLNFVSNV